MVRSEPVRDPAALQSEFDRLAAFEGLGDLGHSDHYLPWLLGQLPRPLGQVVEVGCGSGMLTALLAPAADRLLALDLSPAMLRLARERCARWPNVTFEQTDANAWEPAPRSLDAIVSVATLHHLESEVVLPRWAAALRPGGMLLILDVVTRPGVRNLPVNAVAMLCSVWLRWRRTGRPLADRRVRAAWAAHERFDRLPTLAEARGQARAWLPGARIRHHLPWRYSIRWQSGTGTRLPPQPRGFAGRQP